MVDPEMLAPWAIKAPMSETSIREYLKLQRERYVRRPGRKARGVLLDECAAVTGLERQHLIKVPGGRRPVSGEGNSEGSRQAQRITGAQPSRLSFIQDRQLRDRPFGVRLFGVCGELWDTSHYRHYRTRHYRTGHDTIGQTC